MLPLRVDGDYLIKRENKPFEKWARVDSYRNSVPLNNSEYSSSRDINMSQMENNKEAKR